MTKPIKLTIKPILAAAALLAVLSVSRASYAVGTYAFCPKWAYTYVDKNLGEDYYVYTGAYGTRTAAWTWVDVKRDGATVWSGYTGSSGCTPGVSAVAGTYTVWVTAGLYYPNQNVAINIFPTNSNQWRWFAKSFPLSGFASGTRSYSWDVGAGDTTASVAAIAAGMIDKQDGRFTANNTLKVYSEWPDFVGDASSNYVRLGKDEYFNGNWLAYEKSVIAHELGHMVQIQAFGFQSSPYGDASTVALCTCDHVVHPTLRSHCMQSREEIGAAQTEGYAHFHAADLFNDPSQEDAFYPYYKEIKWNATQESQPPNSISAYFPTGTWHWMEANGCAAANKGTEVDWLNFFYQVKNKGTTKYSYTDIARIFRDACGGGACTGSNTTTWSRLQAAVNTRYGASSAKAQYWAQIGDWQGVNW